jgi:large subunit ribosomal protein L7/L12
MRVSILFTAFAIALSACGPQGPSDADIMAGNIPGENEGTPGPTPIGPQGASSAPIPVPYGGDPAMMPQQGLSVVIIGYGDRKISVIQAVRAARPDLGVADAKTLVESAPQTVKSGLSAADATALQASLEAAGATVSIQ